MATGELKNKVDKLWEMFWTGGLTNPLDVIEQITYLMFIRDLDKMDTTRQKESTMLGTSYTSMFQGKCSRLLEPCVMVILRELETSKNVLLSKLPEKVVNSRVDNAIPDNIM